MSEPLKLVTADVEIDPLNPFANLDVLRNLQDYEEFLAGETISTFPVRTLKEGMHLRVNPDPQYTLLRQHVLDTRQGVYFIWPPFELALGPLPRCCNLHVAVDGHGGYFILLIKQPNRGQDENPWLETARMVSAAAMQGWVRVTKPTSTGGKADRWGYVDVPHAMFDPKWPTKSMPDILAATFPDRVINKPDHDLIKQYEQLGA
jgi:hypothetical protein